MSDNLFLLDGQEIATKEVAGVHHQRNLQQYLTAGVPTDISHADPLPVGDPKLEISRGVITGAFGVDKFGLNPSITSGTTEDVWDGGGTYPFPTGVDVTEIKQLVNQAAMLGANIEVQGLDASWNLVTQVKALDASNTTTAVTLVTPLRRVFRLRVFADVVGNQDIVATSTGGGTVYAQIVAGNNRTLMAIYTVPAGFTAYMTAYYGNAVVTAVQNPKSTLFRLWSADRHNGYAFELRNSRGASEESPSTDHPFDPYPVFTQKTDIKITAKPADKDVVADAGFGLRVLPN